MKQPKSKQKPKQKSKLHRPSWDEYFMMITDVVASRSTCLRRKVGALLVNNKRILATGYNGAVRNARHCGEIGCIREQKRIPSGTHHELCRGLHAEQNALLFARSYGMDTNGAVMYSLVQPCVLCAKMIVQAGITKVVYKGEYPDAFARAILKEGKVKLVTCRARL